jgi:hypothetical protein
MRVNCSLLRWFLFNQRIRQKRRAVELIKRCISALGGVSQVPRFIALYRNTGWLNFFCLFSLGFWRC